MPGVSTQHPDYKRMAPHWQLCDDVVDGEASVHAAGPLYLPRLVGESDPDYKARRDRTPFFGATERTLLGLHGLVMRKPPTVEVPPAIGPYLDDVTLGGESLAEFASEVLEEELTTGRCGILVDYPPMPADGAVTVAQAQALGLRPTLQRYEAKSIINWRYGRINNAQVLTLVVLREGAEIVDPQDPYTVTTEPRYRVLDLTEAGYRQRLYRTSSTGLDEQIGEDVYPLMGGQPLSSIPFVVDPGIDLPPLLALATMNVHHYQVSADHEHGCHLSGLPTMFISGWTPDEGQSIYIGGPTANALPRPEARAYYAEVSGNFAALVANLEAKKQEMAILGARMLETQKAGIEAADTASIHRKGEESILAGVAGRVSERIERALRIFAEWAGADPATVQYALNREFYPTPLDPQFLAALVAGWQSGAYSAEAVYHNLAARDFYPPDTSFEDEQARTDAQAPSLPGVTPTGTAATSAGALA